MLMRRSSMSKRRRHVHARSYWGEGDATHLLAWLNSKTRAANDSIETLVRLNCELVEPDFAKELMNSWAASFIFCAALKPINSFAKSGSTSSQLRRTNVSIESFAARVFELSQASKWVASPSPQ